VSVPGLTLFFGQSEAAVHAPDYADLYGNDYRSQSQIMRPCRRNYDLRHTYAALIVAAGAQSGAPPDAAGSHVDQRHAEHLRNLNPDIRTRFSAPTRSVG
jgi:hypothetical protein